MKLTKNERKTLKLLIENAKLTDTEIADQLKITKQAVGKIKKKLEEQKIIKNHTVEIDYKKLGIDVFAIALLKHTPKEGDALRPDQIENELLKSSNTINIFKLSEGFLTYLVLYGFKDIVEMDKYFKPSQCLICKKNNSNCCLDVQKIHVFSNESIIKNNPAMLLHQAIDLLHS